MVVNGSGEFVPAQGSTTLHSPVLKTGPKFTESNIDHGDILDAEQRRVKLLSVLLNFKDDVEVDA